MEQRLEHCAERTAWQTVNVTPRLTRFLGALDQAFELPDTQWTAMRTDFLRGIDALSAIGLPFSEILRRLDPDRLRGFYAQNLHRFYPLDNGAKQYPLTMRQGQMAMFRIAATLNEAVNPVLLQLALTFALRRFPHYAAQLRRGAFWYYLQSHTARYTISADGDAVCRAIDLADNTQQLFGVFYRGNQVSVELFHVLADGMGGLAFLKSLLAEYYRLRGEDTVEKDTQILRTNDPSCPSDIENGFVRFRGRERGGRLIGRPAVQIPAKPLRSGDCDVDRFTIPASELTGAAHAYSVTVTALMGAVILTACRQTAQAMEGLYQLQVPVDLRRMFPSDSVRNFSWFAALGMNASVLPSKAELAKDLHAQLRAKTTREELLRNVSAAQRTIRWLRYVPLQWKTLLMRTAYRVTGDFFFTTTLSNLGVIQLPGPLRTHVREIAAVLGPSPSNPYSFGLATVGDCALLSVTRTTDDRTLMNRILESARSYGLNLTWKG